MKVLFIHNHYKLAGGEDIAVKLQEELLIQKGDDVRVMLFDNSKIKNGFPLITGINAIYNSSSKQQIAEEIASFKPDVIHIHNLFFLASPSVLFAAHESRIPVIFTLHNFRLICCNAFLLRNHAICELCTQKTMPLSGIKYKCYRSSHVQSALVTAITSVHKLIGTWKHKVHTYIALTEFGKAKLFNSSLHLPEGQMVVVPNFVSDAGIGNEARQNFFLFVGRISPEKGVALLLECFSNLPQQNIVIAGDGPEKEELEKKYSNLPNIKFYGQQSKAQVFALMKQTKAMIAPSIWFEGLPFTIIEALSTGTPVIASRLGAMTEIIQDGYNGFHFESGNADDLRKAVLRFVELEQGEQEHIYRQSRQTYEDRYHPDVYYKSIKSIYKRAIANKKV